jgi:penicillin-binding protein 1A
MNYFIHTLDLKRLLQLLEALQRAGYTMTKLWGDFLRRFPLFLWLLRVLGIAVILGVLALTAFLGSIRYGAFGPLPTKEDLAGISNPLASEVYAADGTLLGRYYFEHRSNVRYKNISQHFVNALVATEDARYFQHHGVDLRAWSRVFFKSILQKDESSGGGSTISQQLAKNLYPRENGKYGKWSLVIHKLKEVFIAVRLENLYTKEEILEMYLNTVPFSENTYGIKVAAQRFFGVPTDSLTAEQSAVLVAMLKATTTYSPVSNPDKSLARRNLVLQQMQRYGYLTRMELDSLQQLPLGLNYSPLNHNAGMATYFREHLRLELKTLLNDYRKPNGMAYNLYTDGLKIYTTLDANMQNYAERAVKTHLAQLQKDFIQHLQGAPAWQNDTILILAKQQSPRYRRLQAEGYTLAQIDSIFVTPVKMKIFDWDGGEKRIFWSPLDSIKYYLSLLNAGFVAVEPATGAVKAWVGGPEYKYFKYDHVKSRRQVGSTFKPIVYATALERGVSPCVRVGNYLRTYPQYNYWTPKNADGKYGGVYNMEGALSNSINTVTVNLAVRMGSLNVARMAENLGMSAGVPAAPAIALGAHEASLLDMVKVYSTFANRGKRPELYYVRRIETARGKVVYQNWVDREQWQQPLTQDHADIMTHMLRSAVDKGTGKRLRYRYKFTNEMAGKTGTSQNHSDGWFVGYTPTLAAGVWVGGESPSVRFRDLHLGQGANMALPVFALFLQQLEKDEDYRQIFSAKFPSPSADVQELMTCSRSAAMKPKVDSTAASVKPVKQAGTPMLESK